MIAHGYPMRATLSIAWCLLASFVSLESVGGLQIVPLLKDPLVVRGSRRFSLRVLRSVRIALSTARALSILQLTCTSFSVIFQEQ